MIELTKYEKEIIRMCKGRHRFKKDLTVLELFAKYYEKTYGLKTVDYPQWKSAIFTKMFNTFMKIRDWRGYENQDIVDIFNASFSQSFIRNQEEPIERAISALYGEIQCTTVKENNVKRFELY